MSHHEACIAILAGEYLMGKQPWLNSKSFVALAIVILVFFLGLVISPVFKLIQRGKKNGTQ